MVSKISKVKTLKVQSEIESLLLEANYIQKYKPKYNVRFADSKAYPLIKITIKDEYPKVLTSRRMDDSHSIYFGPYPNVGALRLVLKLARRIFPYQSVENHPRKICLYNHLGLCPCPEVLNDKSYKKNVRFLVNFLKGNTERVVKDLKKEQKKNIRNEEFEKASEIQRKIESIKLITSPYFKPFEYEENPNLASDIRRNQLTELQGSLNSHGVKINTLKKIECFDISLTSGKYATGSMVVFTDGEKNSSLYRRFKIRYSGVPSDFVMMEELIERRLNHPEWKFPDLIVVDGGKGQVSSALKIINQKSLKIPIIGLAKKEEIIVTQTLTEIKLPKDSKALQLLQRIRDEAHRFAITYHRKLRSKSLFGDSVIVGEK